MMKDTYQNALGYIIMFSICLIAVILMGISVRGYSTYGAPAEFGNLTDTTCYVGGDDGDISCDGTISALSYTGSGKELSGITSGWNLTSSNYLYNCSENLCWNETKGNLTIQSVKVDNCTWADNASWAAASGTVTWDTETSQADLNVNSSDYWNNLDDPSDINAGDITDDNTYCTITGETFTGNIVFDDGVGESPKIEFYNALDNVSQIYEQTDGDLYIKAAKGFELAGSSFRMTTLASCDTIDTDINGVLSCGTDSDIGNCSVDQSCSAILYDTDTGNLNVNDTDYFDGLDSLQFLRSDAADTMEGNLIFDDNSGESPKISFVDGNEDTSYIYEQTTGDLRIEAATNLEMTTGANYVFPNLVSCDTINTDGTGILSCGSDDLVEDTTPALGGYLDTNGNNIGATDDEIENVYVATNSKIYLGDGQEGEIYFDGSKLVIKLN